MSWDLEHDDGHLTVSITDKEADEMISLDFNPDTPVMVCRANGAGPVDRKFAKRMTVREAIDWLNSENN